MIFTPGQIADMIRHVDQCEECGDEEIRAELHTFQGRGITATETEEIVDLIETAHSPEWQEAAARLGLRNP